MEQGHIVCFHTPSHEASASGARPIFAEELCPRKFALSSDGGSSGHSTDCQDTAHSDNAETHPSSPAHHAAAAAADAGVADQPPHPTSLGTDRALHMSFPHLHAAATVAVAPKPAWQPPQQAATASLPDPAPSGSPAEAAGSAGPPKGTMTHLTGAQQPSEQSAGDARGSGAGGAAVADDATAGQSGPQPPGTGRGSGRPGNRKRRAAVHAEDEDQNEEEQRLRAELRAKQRKAKADQRERDEVLLTITCTTIVSASACAH